MTRGFASHRRLVAVVVMMTLAAACGPDPTEVESDSVAAFARAIDPALGGDVLEAVLGARYEARIHDDPTNRLMRDPAAIEIGRRLYFDRRLSSTGNVSCVTCHDPQKDFTDGLPLARGIDAVARHSPSLLNVAAQRWYFWDGRADSLWAQARGPIEAAHEMGGSRARTVALVRDDAELARLWRQLDAPALPANDADDQVANAAFADILRCIAAFEATIVSDDSPFDRFVDALRRRADDARSILSPRALRGALLFFGRGDCTLCHSGPLFTDFEFHNIGLAAPAGRQPDRGRWDGVPAVLADHFNVRGPFSDAAGDPIGVKLDYLAQKEQNLGEFKTPSLRNVGRTAPYFHDGRANTLEDVLRFYSALDDPVPLGHREESLRPLHLDESEISDLVAFLESLTGVVRFADGR